MTQQNPRQGAPTAPVTPAPAQDSAKPEEHGINSWTAHSIFDRKDERKMGRAFVGSLIGHGILFAVLIFIGWRAAQQVVDHDKDKIDVVYLQQPGPGGGGGGSPKPAPQQKAEIPHPKAPEPVPVQPTPVPVPVPDPSINAPVMTNLDNLLQANGLGAVNLAAFGGGGSGGGIGSGTGNGIGPGTGGGFGGGAYHPGNGCMNPQPIKKVDPQYTSDAMRAKLQGTVEVDMVVKEDGSVGDIQVTKSLDKTMGLDEAAIKAARGWVFRPATCKGQPVNMIVTLDLEFRLH